MKIPSVSKTIGLVVGVCFGALVSANAQQGTILTTNFTGSGGTNVLAVGAYYASEVDVTTGSPGGTNQSTVTWVYLYDTTNTALIYTNGAYISRQSAPLTNSYTNIMYGFGPGFTPGSSYYGVGTYTTWTNGIFTAIFTNNSTGQVTTNIYPGSYDIWVTNVANTNNVPVAYAIALSPNSTVRKTGLRLSFAQGITATCNTNNTSIVVIANPTF